MNPITQNTLFYGDNLNILREYIPDKSIDLIYLDPPFNSNRNYNVLFRDESGEDSQAQITAFEDTWHWDRSAEDTYLELVTDSSPQISKMIGALREFIGENQMMAYLVMMTVRLIELHRVLKDTGSLYLHCDPTASHYLKIVLDTIFGVRNFRNEIIWKRMTASGFKGKKDLGTGHDVILRYSKTFEFTYNPIIILYTEEYIKKYFTKTDENGRLFKDEKIGTATSDKTIEQLKREGRIYVTKTGKLRIKHYLDEAKGFPIDDVWADIPPVNSQALERTGYPTQKPLALLERIIQASSNEGDRVLDPFAGCGTAIAAAQKLNRKWIGIDITHLAISLLKYRLRDMQQDVDAVKTGKNYQVIGETKDLAGAQQLARDDPYQFQWWANGLVEAKPLGGDAGSRKGKKRFGNRS